MSHGYHHVPGYDHCVSSKLHYISLLHYSWFGGILHVCRNRCMWMLATFKTPKKKRWFIATPSKFSEIDMNVKNVKEWIYKILSVSITGWLLGPHQRLGPPLLGAAPPVISPGHFAARLLVGFDETGAIECRTYKKLGFLWWITMIYL